jgi:hypothetical protein
MDRRVAEPELLPAWSRSSISSQYFWKTVIPGLPPVAGANRPPGWLRQALVCP